MKTLLKLAEEEIMAGHDFYDFLANSEVQEITDGNMNNMGITAKDFWEMVASRFDGLGELIEGHLDNSSPKKPLVINLFGGPCTGKSVAMAYIYSQLKARGINCEMATEWVKDKVYEHNEKAINCQAYIFGKQVYKLDRLSDNVEVIICDSPILLSAIYNDDMALGKHFEEVVVSKFNSYDNRNYFLMRNHEYQSEGRLQSEDDAKAIDNRIKSVLHKHYIYCSEVETSFDNLLSIVEQIYEEVKDRREAKKDE